MGAPIRAVYKKCIECGASFYCIQSRVNTAKYCSISCGLKGKNNWRWKNGTLNWAGYKLIMVDGKQVREHRYIFEQHIGRKLMKAEEIHHINGIKTDNRIENLVVLDKSSHAKVSYSNRKIDTGGRFV